MSNEVIEHNNNTVAMIADADLSQVTKQLQQIANFQSVVQNNLKKDQDYGVIPGTNKPSLLKPGAEKIQMLFGIVSEYEEIERIQDYDKGFFAYTVKCLLYRNGQKITEGLGHCNTKEKKYLKQDPYTLANTCLKMAKKRAQVDATLTVASLSEVFTQDIEDMKDYAQQESVETMTLDDAKNYKLTFGKHKGKFLKDVDSGYIEWLHDGDRTDPSLRKACSFLLEETKKPKQDEKPKAEMASKQDIDSLNKLSKQLEEIFDKDTKTVWATYGINGKDDLTKAKVTEAVNEMQNELNNMVKQDEQGALEV